MSFLTRLVDEGTIRTAAAGIAAWLIARLAEWLPQVDIDGEALTGALVVILATLWSVVSARLEQKPGRAGKAGARMVGKKLPDSV